MLLTVQHHPHHGLEIAVSELPESKGLPRYILQHAEGDADSVLWREASRVDKPGQRVTGAFFPKSFIFLQILFYNNH